MATWMVTGAAGFVGSHVCERLLDEGERVVGVDNLIGPRPALTCARAERLLDCRDFRLEVVDVTDADTVERLVRAERPDVVVHLAARTGVRGSAAEPVDYATTNVVGSVALLEACRRHDVGHVVYASSSSVYGDGDGSRPSVERSGAAEPLSLYAATKRAGELVAHSYGQLYGLPTTGLRFFTVYGPWGRPDMAYYRFAEAILEGRPVEIYGDGSARRDFTYVDDIVDGVLAVAARPPQVGANGVPSAVYNLGRGSSEPISRLVGLLEELLERPAQRRFLPAVPGDAAATLSDSTALAAAVGVQPRVSLDEGLARFVEWLTRCPAARLGAIPVPGKLVVTG